MSIAITQSSMRDFELTLKQLNASLHTSSLHYCTVTREVRAPRSRLALKGEEGMGDGRGEPSSQQPTTDSAHDITQYRLDRRDIVGIASLLNHIILATVSIPLAGRRLRRRARILRLHTYFATTAPRASNPSEPSSATQLRLRRSGGLNETE